LGFSSVSVEASAIKAVATNEYSPGQIVVGDTFSIEIHAMNDFGETIGISMPLHMYSPDQSILNIIHRNVQGISADSIAFGGITWNDSSITTYNGWDESFFNMLFLFYGTSWDGALPDTINFSGLTFAGWFEEPYSHKISYALQINETGTFCVDSIDHSGASDDTYDWIFDDDNTMFNGPYCWTIFDPNAPTNTAPEVSDIPNQTINEGESFATINLDDYVTDAEQTDAEIDWSYSGNSALTVSISPGRVATISTPGTEWSGAETITFTASDGEFTDSDAAIFTVNAVNDAPVVSGIPDQQVDEGSSFATINLDDYVSDVDNADTEMSWSFSGNLELTVSIVDRVATISIPDTEWSGAETINFTASDGELTDSDEALFTVNPVNDAPDVTDIPDQQVDEGGSFATINLDDYVSDIDNADTEMSWTFSGNSELTVSIVDRVAAISIPDLDWNGAETITFTASDGELTDSDAAMFTVNPVNDAPILAQIATGPIETNEGSLVTLDLSATDPDGTIPEFYAVNMPTLNASLVDNHDGTAQFTFNPDYDQAGTYNIIFYATDGELDDSEPVTIIVNNVINQVQLIADPNLIEFSLGVGESANIGNLTITEETAQEISFWTHNKESWLTLDTVPLTPLVTPEVIPLHASAVGLMPSDNPYYDTIRVHWDVPYHDSIMILVQMTVTADTVIMTDPVELNFVIDEGSQAIDSIAVFEQYDRVVPFDVHYTESWLTVTGMLPYSAPSRLYVNAIDIGLDPGTLYEDTIRIFSSAEPPAFPMVVVPVSLTVTALPPQIVVDPVQFEFTLDQGQGTSDSIHVTELLGKTVDFKAEAMFDSSWLTVLAPPLQMTPDFVHFNVIANMEVGIHADTILIHDTQDGAVFDSVKIPVILTIEEPPPPIDLIVYPTALEITVSTGGFSYDSIHVSESLGRHVAFRVESDQPWISAMWSEVDIFFTPSTVWLYIDAGDLIPGSYSASLSIISPESEPEFDPVIVPVNLTVEDIGQDVKDSVWISTVPGVPGNDVIVPVYFRNFEVLGAINIPLMWSSDAVTLNEVTFDGTAVEYVDNKPVTIDNASRRVQIGVVPTFTPNIAPTRGLLAKLHFTVHEGVGEALVTIDTTTIGPSAISFIDEMLNVITPTFIPGAIVIDHSGGFVCGRVIDTDGNEIEGATVELWDDFPVGAMMNSELTDINGQFACHTTGISPFDAYAYKEGYYPGLVEDIQFGETGIDIVIAKVNEVVPTPEWVDFYCDNNYFYSVLLPVGSVVDAYDPDGVHCGTWHVTEAGKYGFMPVYRDDEYTVEDEGAEPGDEISFFINGYPASTSTEAIWTENGNNFEVCLDVFTVEDRCLEMAEGWNLISWNVDTPTDDIMEILAPISNCVEVVLGFEQGGLTYDPALPEFSTLWQADHMSGYWVKLNCAATLCVEGVPVAATTPIPLTAGWNLVSYLPDVTYGTVQALISIVDLYLVVALGFDGTALTYDPLLPDYSTLNQMAPGYGYWLKVMDNVDLVYPGMGPAVAFNQTTTPVTQGAKAAARYDVVASRMWTDFYSYELTLDGETVPVGTEVLAKSADGRIIGASIVKENGKFGFMPVYADDPATDEIEGLQAGEEFVLVIGNVTTEESFGFVESGARIEIGSLISRTSGDLLPMDFALAQNYPNPFNPATGISFSVPTATTVQIEVYNILGSKVATLFDGMAEAGTNTVVWDGTNDAGQTVATGVYFYRMTAGSFEMTRKMVLMK
jgi:hypothetical protein